MYGESRAELKHETCAELKHETWSLLRNLFAQNEDNPLPWLCAGDFNEILYHHEKEGGVPRAQSCLDRFKEALEFCDLHDLGFVGDVFTWRNKQFREKDYIRERLDRAVAPNGGWRERFPLVYVKNGDHFHSDHRPVVVSLNEDPSQGPSQGGQRAFHFEASWLREEQCDSVVNEAWSTGDSWGTGTVADRLRSIAAGLQSWSVNVLGGFEKKN